jgi:hypothetical protein
LRVRRERPRRRAAAEQHEELAPFHSNTSSARPDKGSFRDGRVLESNYSDYEVTRMSDVPNIEVKVVSTDNPPTGAKRRHIAAFVFEPTSEERFEERIRPRGSLAFSKRFAHLQRRSVPAIQEVGKI